jgi:hypothetical protein
MSEIEELEKLLPPETHPKSVQEVRAFQNYGNRYRNIAERNRMRAKVRAKRDQEIFDRMGLPKGTGQ